MSLITLETCRGQYKLITFTISKVFSYSVMSPGTIATRSQTNIARTVNFSLLFTLVDNVCTETVVKEGDNPVDSVVTAEECHTEYETKCHTVLVSVCYDETLFPCARPSSTKCAASRTRLRRP